MQLPLPDASIVQSVPQATVVDLPPRASEAVCSGASPQALKHYKLPNDYIGQTALYSHQARGIARLAKSREQLLADEPGLGKTLQALYSGCCRIKGREIRGLVVACKNKHAHIWYNEIQTHEPRLLSLTQSLVNLPPTKRVFDERMRIWIVNYEVLAREVAKHAYMLRHPLSRRPLTSNEDVRRLVELMQRIGVLLIADESNVFSNPSSRTTKTMCGIAQYARARIAITGTPVAERSWNIWAQVFFLDFGKTLGRSYNSFLSRYAVMRYTQFGAKPVGGRNLHELHERLRPIMIRRLADNCLDLPQKLYKYSPYVVPKSDGTFLLDKHTALLSLLGKMNEDELARDITVGAIGGDDSCSRLMTDAMRAAALPALFDPEVKAGKRALWGGLKYEHVLDAVNEEQDPIIVWCIHRNVAEAYAQLLQGEGLKPLLIHGGVAPKKRPALLAQFKENGYDILVATCAALRDGETLVNSRRAVYVQRDYVNLNWTQSQKRIHRIGQTRRVLIDVPVLSLGLDLHVGDVLTSKNIEANAVVDGHSGRDSTLSARSLLSCLQDGALDMHAHIAWWMKHTTR